MTGFLVATLVLGFQKMGVEPVPPRNIGDGSPIAFTAWHGVRRGEGKLSDRRVPVRLEIAKIALEANGRFVVVFQGARRREVKVEGRWKRANGKQVHLTVSTLDGKAGRGLRGAIGFMDRANPARIVFGRRQGLPPFLVDFRVRE